MKSSPTRPTSNMRKVLFVTTSLGKLQEARAVAKRYGLTLLGSEDLGIDSNYVENGKSYQENTLIKIQHSMAQDPAVGLTTIADDSGFEITALGNRPGIHTHRWFQKFENDANFSHYFEDKIKNLSGDTRKVSLVTWASFVSDQGETKSYHASIEGVILPRPVNDVSQKEGFLLRSLFYVPKYQCMLHELSPLYEQQELRDPRSICLDKMFRDLR